MGFAVNRLARTGIFFALWSVSILLVACGGGTSQPASGGNTGGGNPPSPGGSVPQVSLSGGGVKGPLAYAPLAFYEFDASTPDFQAPSPVSLPAKTDGQASFSGVLVPAPNPPYILVFTADAGTIDLTTGTSPVITTMKTVVTADMLSQGYPIYATPLTTLAVDLAIANVKSTQSQTVDNFLLALPIAARQVASSVGFGISNEVDIFRTWPVVGTDGSTEALRATAEYRSAVEAFSTLVYDMARSADMSTTQMMNALVADLGDGIIDGKNAAGTIAGLGTTQLDLLKNADPANLKISNSEVLVGDVEELLANEAVTIGATADTTALTDGTIQVNVQAAQLDPDTDGDGVMNVVDAFPTDAARDTDTDGDGIADILHLLDVSGRRTGVTQNLDADDDDDGLTDDEELLTDPLLADTDNDGLLDSIEIAPKGSSITITYGAYAGTYTGTGTNPLLSDSDNDGVLDGVEVAAPGSTVIIGSGPNAGTYTGIGTDPLNNDTDGDTLNDGAEVEALTNPLSTDSDGDGRADNDDNCPAVANADQLDINPVDGVGDACAADLTGVWKLTFQPVSMTWNGCDKSLLGKSYTAYHSITQNGGGVLAATDHRGLEMSGTITVGTNRFALSGTRSEVNLYGTTTVRTVSLAGRKNLDDSVSGSYVILDKINGTATCQESGEVSATFVYRHSGEEAYSGKYALEYVDHALPLRGSQSVAKQNSGFMQVAISGTGFEMHDYRAGSSVVSSSYDPDTGVFHESTLHQEVTDLNADGIDDVHRVTSELTGIMVRAAGDASGATLVFARTIKEATYFNLSAYDPAATPNFHVEQRLDGYGRPVMSSAYNETVTRPGAEGTPVAVDRFGLANPPLWKETAASALRFETFAGTVETGTLLCSVPFDTGLFFVENYPEADSAAESLRSGAYGDIVCEAGPEGSVVATGSYTLAVIDDMGTPLDETDDIATSSFPLTAAVTNSAPVAIPARREVRVDGAGSSQTQIDARIAIDGYFNPYAAHTFTWPDQGASGYRLRLWKLNAGTEVKKQIRVASATNSAVLPAGVLSDTSFTAFEVDARYDAAGTTAWATGQTLTVFPFLNGLFNVETRDPVSGDELNFQLALQRTDFDTALCTVTFSNRPLTCASYHLVVNWDNDAIALSFTDPSDVINGGEAFYLIFQFSDAATAAVSSVTVPYQGAARRVTTELVARNQVQADGTQSTLLTLENPPPLFTAGELTSQSGTVSLDGLGSTVTTLWDDIDLDPSNDFTNTNGGLWEHPGNDDNPPAVAAQLEIDSAALSGGSYVLPDGGYRVSFMNHQSQAMADAVFAVDAAAVDAVAMEAVRGPVLTGIRVNDAAAAVGIGDGGATAIDVSAQSVFDLAWDAMAAAADTHWAVVIRRVDGLGQPIPGQEWRTPFMDPATDAALVYTAGTWSWANTTLDLADYLAAGDVAQVQLISRDAGGGLQGVSDPVYVRRGP